MSRKTSKRAGTKGHVPLSAEERALLSALAAALHGTPVPEPCDADPTNLLALAEKHKVTPLLYDVFATCADAAVRESATRAARQNARQFWRLLLLTRSCVNALAAAGVPSVVLKGVSAARLWHVPEQRKAGDIDLLPLDQDRFADAARAVESLGFVRDDMQLANHQEVYRLPDGLELELHRALVEDFDNPEANDLFARLRDGVADHVETADVIGVPLPVLDLPHQAFHLLSHMLQDFLRHGFGLRLLCDWVALWEQPDAEVALPTYLALVRELRAEGFSRTVSALCVRWLGLTGAAADALAARADATAADELLREVLDAGEFGYSSVNRMVVPRSKGPLGLAREFHHQTALNYPRAVRFVPAWPALWVATLARFLYHNRVTRHTTLREVLRTASERSHLHQKMGIFQGPGT